jgi:hypothetical protein
MDPFEAWQRLQGILTGWIVESNSESEMQTLLKDKSIDLDRRDGSGRTLLDYIISVANERGANQDRCLARADSLIKHGANPNTADKRGWTPLHQCAVDGNMRMVKYLVTNGAKVNVANDEGHLPLDLALMKKNHQIAQYLEAQSGNLKSLCRLAIRDCMGKRRTYNQIDQLPLPSSLKLFVNYGNPFPGWKATLYVPCPWTTTDISSGLVDTNEVKQFIEDNAHHEFLKEQTAKKPFTNDALAEIIEALYYHDAFKTIDYQEQLARKPRYSMEALPKDEETQSPSFIKRLLKYI